LDFYFPEAYDEKRRRKTWANCETHAETAVRSISTKLAARVWELEYENRQLVKRFKDLQRNVDFKIKKLKERLDAVESDTEHVESGLRCLVNKEKQRSDRKKEKTRQGEKDGVKDQCEEDLRGEKDKDLR
jgi:hypothetical protein